MRYSPYLWRRPNKASLQMTMQLLCQHPAACMSPCLQPRAGLNRHGPDTAMNEAHKRAARRSREEGGGGGPEPTAAEA